MENYGFFRVAAAIPELQVADCSFNTQQMKELMAEACKQGVQIICFPELSVTAYTCGDLFLQEILVREAERALKQLLDETSEWPICFIAGAPVEYRSKLYNCALVCCNGRIAGIVPKTYLPNYSEFYEKRWFETYGGEEVIDICWGGQTVPFGGRLLFSVRDQKFALEICEDVWSIIPPSSYHSMAGAQLLFNLSASNELIGKRPYIQSLLSQQSARCQAAYVYAAAGFGESTTDLVYVGNAYIYENGKLLAESKRFQFEKQLIVSDVDLELLNSERKKNTTFVSRPAIGPYREITIPLCTNGKPLPLMRSIDSMPFVPVTGHYQASCEEIFSIQVAGLAKRLLHTHAQTLLIGVSGGLDSTLALLVCVKTVEKIGGDRKMICGVTMPGFGTTGRTYANAVHLMQSLGITRKEINIAAACEQHFKDIAHDPQAHDITYENVQARERMQILMDLANQMQGIVVGTGDLSELALGWTTYNGDQMSMYGVNAGVPKTLVRHLVRWAADTMDESSKATLLDIVDTPVSPELLPVDPNGQTPQWTENVIGPYELHDFFLYYTLRYGFSPSKVYYLAQHAFQNIYDNTSLLKWMEVFYRRFFSQQFKRSCMPDGPKVGSVNLSPRGDWRMPSDASAHLWMKEIQRLAHEVQTAF
ncbi:MAG: NAD(+) synthase [Candidatus Azobacteroides sp.]|nr:NAD(+) synthase [Candidatus Azobacteroides sp.]